MTYADIIGAYTAIEAGNPNSSGMPTTSALSEAVSALMYAAMYDDLGEQGGRGRTHRSRSGRDVVFAQGYRMNDRADLSGMLWQAKAQLEYAGLDAAALDEARYQEHRQTMEHDIARWREAGVRIQVTGIFSVERGRSLIACNRVSLLDGAGDAIAGAVVECDEVYEPQSLNKMGRPGAYRNQPDRTALASAIRGCQQVRPNAAIHYGASWRWSAFADEELAMADPMPLSDRASA